MSRTKRITDSIRAQVLELRKKGYTLKAIAIELDISLSSVKRFKAEGSSSEVQNSNIEVQEEMQISNFQTSSFQIKSSSLEKGSNLEKNTEQVNSSVKQLIDDKNFERLKNIISKYYDTLRAKITDEEIQNIAEKLILNIPKGLKIDIEIIKNTIKDMSEYNMPLSNFNNCYEFYLP